MGQKLWSFENLPKFIKSAHIWLAKYTLAKYTLQNLSPTLKEYEEKGEKKSSSPYKAPTARKRKFGEDELGKNLPIEV